jgi:PKD repeat protein
MATRITTQDAGYTAGSLSLFPQAKDSVYQLYEAVNNAETKLKQSLTYGGKYIIVDDNSTFPSSGILRIGPPPGIPGAAEMVYYDTKTTGVFRDLIRGFAGSRQNPWPLGSVVTQSVFAEHHNSVKDAILNMEVNLGVEILPAAASLNGILKAQENRFLAPRAIFRAFPIKGPPGTKVRFQNFSTGPLVRYLWDFGDGTTSVERSPMHIYQAEGTYTVKLNIITALGAQGISEKVGYITISETAKQPFFYVTPSTGISLETAVNEYGDASLATTFNLVDQTDGNIVQRYWVFDGAGKQNGIDVPGETEAVYDPNIHSTTYVYDKPGTYAPSLLVLFENQNLQRAFLRDEIVVT